MFNFRYEGCALVSELHIFVLDGLIPLRGVEQSQQFTVSNRFHTYILPISLHSVIAKKCTLGAHCAQENALHVHCVHAQDSTLM